jgi:hypothetical protein
MQSLSEEATIKILQKGTSGVLAVTGDDGYPYAVPLSYVYEAGKIYFHFAVSGHKLDALERSDKVSFCVIGRDEVISETFTTRFSSVIVFGRMRLLAEDKEKRCALSLLANKYSPGLVSEAKEEIDRSWNRVVVGELRIEHMTGKAALEVVRKRKWAESGS